MNKFEKFNVGGYWKADDYSGEDSDDLFILCIHSDDTSFVGMTLTDEEINQLNQSGLDNTGLPASIDYYMNALFRIDIVEKDNVKFPLDKESVEQAIECHLYYSGIIHSGAFEQLLSQIKKKYERKISISEFEQQVWKIEGVKIKVFNKHDKDAELNELYSLIDPYPFITGMDGEKTVEDLMRTRIDPLLDAIVPQRWW